MLSLHKRHTMNSTTDGTCELLWCLVEPVAQANPSYLHPFPSLPRLGLPPRKRPGPYVHLQLEASHSWYEGTQAPASEWDSSIHIPGLLLAQAEDIEHSTPPSPPQILFFPCSTRLPWVFRGFPWEHSLCIGLHNHLHFKLCSWGMSPKPN